MELIAIALIVLATGTMCVTCLLLGVRIGQAAAKAEPVTIPKPTLSEKRKKQETDSREDLERQRLEAILRNVDNYNGTEMGQRDIPGR